MNIRSMRHRACMRHLPYMHTPVRLGVRDGAIDVTPAAVGKVSDSRRGYSGSGASLSALKQTCALHTPMSAKCQKPTLRKSFDQLVGASEKHRWYGEAEGFGGLEVNYEVKFCGLHDRQVGWWVNSLVEGAKSAR